jgi:hypothetical protein
MQQFSGGERLRRIGGQRRLKIAYGAGRIAKL